MFLKIAIHILPCKKEKLQVLDSFTLITFIYSAEGRTALKMQQSFWNNCSQLDNTINMNPCVLERRIIMGYISYYIIWKKNKNIIGVFHVVTKWATTTNQTIKFLN